MIVDEVGMRVKRFGKSEPNQFEQAARMNVQSTLRQGCGGFSAGCKQAGSGSLGDCGDRGMLDPAFS